MIEENAQPLQYLERIKSYYIGLGFDKPYVWANQKNVPLTPIPKPVSCSKLGIVTTASIFNSRFGDQGPGAAYNGKSKFFETYSAPIIPFPDVRISHLAYDRAHTSATDMGTYFPLSIFLELANIGIVGGVSKNFYGLPTNRSQRTTVDVDCANLVNSIQQDDVDIVVLVPNCPVCHQSTALAATQLEAHGIPTVIMGCAKDITEYVGAPRFLFSDLPLGNSAGLPHDKKSQRLVAELAIEMFSSVNVPRITWQSPLKWSGAVDWKKDYSNIRLLSEEKILLLREEFERVKIEAKKIKNSAGT